MTASQLQMEAPVTEAPAPAEEEPPRRRRRVFFLFFLLAMLLVLLLLATWYLLFRQPIVPPLPGIPDTSMPHYFSSMYGVDGPIGVATTSSGDRIFVAHASGTPGVEIFDGGGTNIGTFETPPGPNHSPVYIAVHPLTQEVYVTDRLAGAIWIYDGAGRMQRKYEPAEAKPGWQPLGIAFDRVGNLYVTDVSGTEGQVDVFDSEGRVVRSFGAGSGLAFPNGVSIDDAGNAWLTDSNNGRLLVFDPAGSMIGQIGRGVGEGNLGLPRGVVVAGERVFVADNTAHGVFGYRPLEAGEGRPSYVGFFGGEGIAEGEFEFPNGIAADGRGRVYVADFANDRVQVWSY